jgi:hypothetical protein
MYSRAQAKSFVLPADESSAPAMAKRTATEMSDASECALKRFTVVDYNAFDASLLSVTDRGKKPDGTPVFVASYNSQKLVLQLTPGKKWLQVKYRIDQGIYDVNKDFLKVKLVVGEQVAQTIAHIEEKVKKAVTSKLPDAVWKMAVEEGLFTAKLIHIAKNPSQLTQCKVRPFGKDVVTLAGEEQLRQPLRENNFFMGAKAKAVVAAESVWIMAGEDSGVTRAGVNWKIHHFVVDLPERVRWVVPNVFENVCWDDKEDDE